MLEALALLGAFLLGSDCSKLDSQIGNCSIDGSLGDDGATLEGITTGPDGGGGGEIDLEGGGASDEPGSRCIYLLNDRCFALGPDREAPVVPITLADIEQFRPQVASHGMEPNGWVVIGLDANFFSSAAAHVIPGTLLGEPAEVRFTPIEWTWNYGDGTAATHPVGGAPWGALGIPEFSPTATSHVFRTAGSFVVDLTVTYRAEYRVGPLPWTAIPGSLAVAAAPIPIVSGDATTVLVDRDCAANPAGPGC